MYRNDGVVVFEKIFFKFGFEKDFFFNKIPFLHKAFHGDFWKGFIMKHHPRSITKLITGQTYFALSIQLFAMRRTMSTFVL